MGGSRPAAVPAGPPRQLLFVQHPGETFAAGMKQGYEQIDCLVSRQTGFMLSKLGNLLASRVVGMVPPQRNVPDEHGEFSQ